MRSSTEVTITDSLPSLKVFIMHVGEGEQNLVMQSLVSIATAKISLFVGHSVWAGYDGENTHGGQHGQRCSAI